MRGTLATAALALATPPIGLAFGLVVQLTIIVILLTGMLNVERRIGR